MSKKSLKPCPRCNGEVTVKDLGLELNTFEIRCKTPYCLSMVLGGGSIDDSIETFNIIAEKGWCKR